MSSFAIAFDTRSLFDGLDALALGAAQQTRPAAQAAAQVLYDEARQRAPVAARPHKTKSGRIIAPGALRASIYQAYSRDNSSHGHSTYHVSWNYRKAPHGHLVEFGTSRAAAHPFLRPAFEARHAAALQAAQATLVSGMQNVIARLGR
jgi:HK97 gp10 family phage protein